MFRLCQSDGSASPFSRDSNKGNERLSLGLGTIGKWTDAAISGSQSNHAWNEAYADGRWVILDTTWDLDNRYEKGSFSNGTGMTGRLYFDPTLEFFSTDHRIMPEGEYDRWERERAFQKEEPAAIPESGTCLYDWWENYLSVIDHDKNELAGVVEI